MHARAWRVARAGGVITVALALLVLAPTGASGHEGVGGDPEHAGITDDPADDLDLRERLQAARDPAAALAAHDQVSDSVGHHDRRGRDRTDDLRLLGRGERLAGQVTTDVWAHRDHAYIGTFNEPCGTGDNFEEGVARVDLVRDVEAPGVAIFDVDNPRRPRYVGNLPSVAGSRSNDVKVENVGPWWHRRDILIHTNESCADGPGGVELYDVTRPNRPKHLSSIRIDEINRLAFEVFGGVTDDVGVHNVFIFEQGRRDFVSVVAETGFDNFMTFDITDPTSPELVSAWGAEEVFDPGVGDETEDVDRVTEAAIWLSTGFGNSQNRFLHDITYDAQGKTAYLSNWDAGLVRIDMSDPADPQVVSVALDPENGSLDGEVNSHAAWPSEDGSIVVETEEDFSAFEATSPPGNLTFGDDDPNAPLPGTAVATVAGDDFEANQTGNTGTVTGSEVTVTDGPLAGTTYPAIELAGDQPAFPEGGQTGELVFVGRLCDVDEPLNADAVDPGDVAVVRRGECSFREKNFNAADLGASAIVIANNLQSTPWGGVRIWDYSDPANPVLASTFDTECSAASEPTERCDAAGTWSVHNVIVESRGHRTLAYISWYWDGMLVLDVTDPSNPVEVARFFDDSPEFIEENGGNPHDFWGVYKIRNRPTIYAADRNGGLYTFRLK